MYLPPHFEESDSARIAGLVAAFPLAVIFGQTKDGPVGNHIPLLMNGPDELIGHVALANDMHRVMTDGQAVLAVFRGEDGYVSPNWYPTKPQHHKHVPTWNYAAVHCYGQIYFSHENKAKRSVVGRMTKHFETQMNGADAWRMAEAPTDYMADMIDNIVALRIEIGRVIAKAKLSQNREAVDARNAALMMEKVGKADLGRRMRRALGDAQSGDDEAAGES